MNTYTSSSTSNMLMSLAAVTITTLLLPNLPLITADHGSLETDKEALLVFYHALESVGTRLDWETKGKKVCEWQGIYCTDEENKKSKVGGGGGGGGVNRVVRISLPAVGLKGAIAADSLGRLDALEKLSLRENSLSGNLPIDIIALPKLKKINIKKNKFSGDLPEFIKYPRDLETVDFSFNSFSGTIPSVFTQTTELKYLDLQSNLFSGNIPDFGLLKNIKVLYLGQNELEGPIPPSLQKEFKEDSFIGNPGLCGKPLDKPCEALGPGASPPLSAAAYSNKLGEVVLMVSSLSLFLFLLLL